MSSLKGTAQTRDVNAPLVSVVVPTQGRLELLSRCLEALRRQSLPSTRFEVIVVDDSEESAVHPEPDPLLDDARPGSIQVRYLRTGLPSGPARARNLGWCAARASVIAFTDDDCIPDPNWLTEGLHAMTSGLDGVSGRIVVPLGERPTDYERNAAALETAEFATANVFYSQEALRTAGGFDERYRLAWREDADLYLRLVTLGKSLGYAPDAIVVHPVRPAPWGISLLQQHKSMYNALLYKKYPALYRERIQSTPPWSYYLSVLACFAGIVGRDYSPRLARLGTAVWAGMTIRFCVRRLRGTSLSPAHVVEMAITSALIPFLSVGWRLTGAIRFRVVFL